MNYNFDEVIDRRGTCSEKVDGMVNVWGKSDLIPMWVADMDFATPPFILEAIRKRCEHPVLGYTFRSDDYYQSIIGWVKKRYGMSVEKEEINFVPGIVPGLGMAINCFTKPGDKIMIMPPVYHPFAWLVTRNNRRLVECPLKEVDGYYRMDLDLIRRSIKGVRVLILCNPHNPGGVVWKKEELQELAEICADDNVIVFSDEIHADLTLPPYQHLPFAMVSEKARNNSVTFMAPSKTFNIAGIVSSYSIIPNEDIRRKFYGWLSANELDEPTIFSPIATIAAFRHGEEYRQQMLAYIEENIRFVEDFCREHIPGIRPLRPQASFLVWLNCRDLHLNHEQLLDLFIDKAHLALNDGEMFGPGGEGFMRLNVASPRVIIRQALEQLAEAVGNLS